MLPLRLLTPRCRRIGSGGSGKLSSPLTHDTWTTWRHKKSKISSWGMFCKGREHKEQRLFAVFFFSCLSSTPPYSKKKGEKRSHVKKTPPVWFFCSICENPEISPFKTVWHPSSNDICKWKSCNILIKASCNPGISSPFLIRLISRIGLISTPTFSSKPRMKAICQKKKGGSARDDNEK